MSGWPVQPNSTLWDGFHGVYSCPFVPGVDSLAFIINLALSRRRLIGMEMTTKLPCLLTWKLSLPMESVWQIRSREGSKFELFIPFLWSLGSCGLIPPPMAIFVSRDGNWPPPITPASLYNDNIALLPIPKCSTLPILSLHLCVKSLYKTAFSVSPCPTRSHTYHRHITLVPQTRD